MQTDDFETLSTMTVDHLHVLDEDLWFDRPRSRNRTCLIRKMASRLQSLEPSALTDRAVRDCHATAPRCHAKIPLNASNPRDAIPACRLWLRQAVAKRGDGAPKVAFQTGDTFGWASIPVRCGSRRKRRDVKLQAGFIASVNKFRTSHPRR
jgi:hypothetical protein